MDDIRSNRASLSKFKSPKQPPGKKFMTMWCATDNAIHPKVHSFSEGMFSNLPVMLYSYREMSRGMGTVQQQQPQYSGCPFLRGLLSGRGNLAMVLKYYNEHDDTCSGREEKKFAVRHLMRKYLNLTRKSLNDILGNDTYNIDGWSSPVQLTYDKVLEASGYMKALSWVKRFRCSFEPLLEDLKKQQIIPRTEERNGDRDAAIEKLYWSICSLKLDTSTPYHVLLETLLGPESPPPDLKNRRLSRLSSDPALSSDERVQAAVARDRKTIVLAMECTALTLYFARSMFRNYVCKSEMPDVDVAALRTEVETQLVEFCEFAVAEYVPRETMAGSMEECTRTTLAVAESVYAQINMYLAGNVRCKDYMSLPTHIAWGSIQKLSRAVLSNILVEFYDSPEDISYVSKLVEEYLNQRLHYGHLLARKCVLVREWISKLILEKLSDDIYPNLFLRDSARIAMCIVSVLELLYGDLNHLPYKRIDLRYDEECQHLTSLVAKLDFKDSQPDFASKVVIAEYELKKQGLDDMIKKDLAAFMDTAAKQMKKALDFFG